MLETRDIFPSKWAPQFPDRLQLYSLATPNGKKVSIALEELGLTYEAHRIDILNGEQNDPGFRKVNPNGKIPCIIDPAGADGKPLRIMESGAILVYLAEKAGKLMPKDPEGRSQTLQWLFFQVGGVGPFFGQLGHFYKFARDKTSDDYGIKRYSAEVKRLLGVLEAQLEEQPYLVGEEYTIADIATVPWIQALDFYEAKNIVDYSSFAKVDAWVQRCASRPAFQRGAVVCAI